MTTAAEENEPSDPGREASPTHSAELPAVLRDSASLISRAEVQRMFETQAAHWNEQLEARDAKIDALERRIVAIHDHYADQAQVLDKCKELLAGFCGTHGVPLGDTIR